MFYCVEVYKRLQDHSTNYLFFQCIHIEKMMHLCLKMRAFPLNLSACLSIYSPGELANLQKQMNDSTVSFGVN